MIKFFVLAFFGCNTPGVQYYTVEGIGWIKHDLKSGEISYLDLDDSTEALNFNSNEKKRPCKVSFSKDHKWEIKSVD